jgi:hypothetical protein
MHPGELPCVMWARRGAPGPGNFLESKQNWGLNIFGKTGRTRMVPCTSHRVRRVY